MNTKVTNLLFYVLHLYELNTKRTADFRLNISNNYPLESKYIYEFENISTLNEVVGLNGFVKLLTCFIILTLL